MLKKRFCFSRQLFLIVLYCFGAIKCYNGLAVLKGGGTSMEIIKAQIHAESRVVQQPGLARELPGCFENEQLILRQVLPSGGVSVAENPGVDGKSLDSSHNVCNFLNLFFGGGNYKLAIKEGLGLLFLSLQILCQQICSIDKLTRVNLSH